MLSFEASSLPVRISVLSPSKTDSAMTAPNIRPIVGDPFKATDLMRLFEQSDRITFESELIPASLIQKASQITKSPVFAPSIQTLGVIQDRLTQKNLIEDFHFQTASFLPVSLKSEKNDTSNILNTVFKQIGPFVLKKRTGGYDGYGTFIFKNQKDISQIQTELSGGFIAETLILFKHEMAITAVRNQAGDILFLPLVKTFQENARCLWVCGPYEHKQLKDLKNKIKTFLNHIHYEGAMAFELFDTGEDLLVNELAPRVHNSAHYSLDALTESQFALHLKGILGKDLKPPQMVSKGFAMWNLIGSGVSTPKWKVPEEVHLHWYHKSPSRKGRKMGHINALGSSPEEALNRLKEARRHFKV